MSTVQSAKVVLLGDAGVGKTSLLRAICGHPITRVKATFAAEFIRVPLPDQYRGYSASVDSAIRQFLFWDTPGQGLESRLPIRNDELSRRAGNR